MAAGLKLPLGVDLTGRGAVVDGEDNDRKIIMMALGACYNENAFTQNIGLGGDMVFDLSDDALRARILRRLVTIFDEFVLLKRYRLDRNTIKWSEDPNNQELTLEFKYINLETDERLTFTRRFIKGA